MKKIIFFLIFVVAAAWILQNYTDFKAIDLAEKYYRQIDFQRLKTWAENWQVGEWFDHKKLPDPEKQLNIFIRNGVFLPNKNAVKTGIKVTWYNEDSKPHAISGDGWGGAEIAPGQAYSRVFDLAGIYSYQCSLHPSEKGEIIVN